MLFRSIAALGSDRFAFGSGPVEPTSTGPTELRFRAGARARISITDHLDLAPEIAVEDVEREAFVPGARRINTLLRAQLVWRAFAPRSP